MTRYPRFCLERAGGWVWDKDDRPGTHKRSSPVGNQRVNSQWQYSEACAVRGLEVPMNPGCPKRTRAEVPPRMPAVTWSEGPGDQHSRQHELPCQRAAHRLPRLSHLV